MAPFVLLKSVRFAQLRKSANDAAIDRQRIFSSCDLSAKLNGSSVFLPRLLHRLQGVVNESSTAFTIPTNRMRVAYGEKIQPHSNFYAWRDPHTRTPYRGVGSRHRLWKSQPPG